MRKKLIRTLSIVTVVLVNLSVISGCGSASKTKSSDAAVGTKPEAPTEISIMVDTTATEVIDNTNIIWQEIEKKTNTKLNITWVPQGNYTEKLNVTLASGNMPDMTRVDPMSPNVINTALNGAFWEVGKYVKDYPNISKYPEDIWKNTKYPDGKNYIIPKTRPLAGAGNIISFRQDWLDKLKLKMPETLDEVTNVIKTMVNSDPDGNGQKDTTGFVPFIASDGTGLGSLGGLFNTAFGSRVSTNLYEKDGTVQVAITTPEYKKAIGYLRNLYAEGLMHKDFATMKQQQVRDAGMSGKVASISENIPGSWVVSEGLRKIVPNAEFVAVSYLKNASGKKLHFLGNGLNGGFAIKKQGNDENRLKKILKFIDATASDEVWEIANYGFKDTHFTKTGDIYKQTEQAKKDKIGQIYMGQIASKFERFFYAYNAPGIPMESIERNKKAIEEIEKVGQSDFTFGVISDTWTKYSKEYDKKLTDHLIKIILGTETLDSWDAYASKIANEDNFKKAMSELQAGYKVKMGK
jgi:putative aldouronate transport system substrate-binding protein